RPVDEDAPRRGLDPARDEAQQRGLAGADSAQNGDELSRRDLERRVVEREAPARIAESDVLDRDRARYFRALGRAAVADLRLPVQNLEKSRGRRGGAQIEKGRRAEGGEDAENHAGIEDEGDERAEAQIAAQDLGAADAGNEKPARPG